MYTMSEKRANKWQNIFDMSICKEANPQRLSTEIIIEIKQLNTGRMALHASIVSVWCSHWEIIFSSKMEKQFCKSRSLISITFKF